MAKKLRLFFNHDASASRDGKILLMKVKYGARGYGLYWEIIEYLFEQGGSAPLVPRMVAMAINEDVRGVRPFLMDCIDNFNLFKSDGKYFWSDRLSSELDRIEDISTKRSIAASGKNTKKKGKNMINNELESTGTETASCNCTTIAEQLQSNCTLQEKKGNETKEFSTSSKDSMMQSNKLCFGEARNVFLTQSEHSLLVDEYGVDRTMQIIGRLSNYKASTGKSYRSDFYTIKLWMENSLLKDSKSSIAANEKAGFKPKLAVSIWDEQEAQA